MMHGQLFAWTSAAGQAAQAHPLKNHAQRPDSLRPATHQHLHKVLGLVADAVPVGAAEVDFVRQDAAPAQGEAGRAGQAAQGAQGYASLAGWGNG